MRDQHFIPRFSTYPRPEFLFYIDQVFSHTLPSFQTPVFFYTPPSFQTQVFSSTLPSFLIRYFPILSHPFRPGIFLLSHSFIPAVPVFSYSPTLSPALYHSPFSNYLLLPYFYSTSQLYGVFSTREIATAHIPIFS